jgi:serine/threonine protein kinase/formylglycine-generating enzyme required for sulfatase activity
MQGLAGQTIGRYRIIEHVGHGGMADVYKAYQPSLDRHVAIKVIHAYLADDGDFLSRFEREARVVATLRHPNIVQVYDFDAENGLYYMVMEFIDGGTLKTLLDTLQARGTLLGLADAARIILAVGSALKYAHSRNMVHRDVKPGNVMITGDGHVILTDFGIAKIVSATKLTASGAMVGTPAYMSPEQGRGEPGDERSDLYSLGVMLYQLLVGRLPYDADTPVALVLKHINDPLPLPTSLRPDLSPELERVIVKALAKKPEDRYQTVAAMTADLKAAVGLAAELTPIDTMQRDAAIRLTSPGAEAEPSIRIAPLQSDVSPASAPAQVTGRKLALIIGNSEYEDGSLAQLVTPGADATELAGVLSDPAMGGFDEVTPLINQPVAAVRRAISRFYADKQRDDVLLLYFSGHGVLDDRGQLYLAVKDTERDLLRGTALGAAFIADEMDRSYSRRQVLILDCCQSGAFARGSKGAPGLSVGTAAAFEGTGYSRVVLTATDSTQYAWEGDQVIGEADKSIFTHYLVEGLQTGAADANADGWITLDELYDYVHSQVVTRTSKQTPAMWTYKQHDSFVIARNPYPVSKPAELPAELQTAVKSTSIWMREGAVRELDRMLNGTDPELACVAYGTLTTLSSDDSRRVSDAAAKTLATYVEAWHQRTRAAGEQAQAASQPDLNTAAIEPATAAPATPPARRSVPRAALIGVAALVLLAVVAAIFALSRSGQPAVTVQPPPLPVTGAMVKVDAGTYRVGRDAAGGSYAPAQAIEIGQFWIDQYEVTNAQYAAFLAAASATPPAGWVGGNTPAGQNDYPVEGVTWDQAAAFCQWAGKRLPGEAEWEVAARGPKGSLYPWGDDERAVTLPDGKTYAVGQMAANRSAFGAFDMAGNVWEWVGTTYAPVPEGHKVLHGGGYGLLKDMAYRLHGEPNVRTMFAMAGIRCAADHAPEGSTP